MKVVNKQARRKYKLGDKIEAGVVLNGAEVKQVKRGNIDISRAYAKIMNSEAFLINANIPVPGKKDYDSTRTRKLLLHRKQITSIATKIKAKKLTLVPTKVYNKGNLVKVEIALGKAKRKYEKREALKKRDEKRQIERALREDKREHQKETRRQQS